MIRSNNGGDDGGWAPIDPLPVIEIDTPIPHHPQPRLDPEPERLPDAPVTDLENVNPKDRPRHG